jgi:hypothetical protein
VNNSHTDALLCHIASPKCHDYVDSGKQYDGISSQYEHHYCIPAPYSGIPAPDSDFLHKKCRNQSEYPAGINQNGVPE